ncbi:MAG: hypothetical protein GXP55_16570 [Deltaproteobacteria bacterium]|nr:hypothetical protein [Deltaproteobacteria bacterium]
MNRTYAKNYPLSADSRRPLICVGLAALLLAACGGSGGSPCPDGTAPSGGACVPVTDGGIADGDVADGDLVDGDVADGDVTDGAIDDAGAIDGDVADGAVVDGCVTTTYHPDSDLDGFGDADETADACEAPAGFVEDATDCDDADADVHPGATEVCDGVDNDCNAMIDDGVATTYHPDSDTDGFGDADATLAMDACEAPAGFVEDATDCDDTDADVHPGATEVCDGIDNDCNAAVDDALAAPACALTDGVCSGSVKTCGGAAGWLDCDATSYGASYEAGTETLCDGLDNDCDGVVDNHGVRSAFYRDSDRDGFGNPARRRNECAAPAGFVSDNTDCDDTLRSVNPGATEVCNGTDDDCDGTVDEGVKTRYYRDRDRDMHGDASDAGALACAAPANRPVTNNDDCDDRKAAVHPGQAEICDGLDNDCNGVADDGLIFRNYYADTDGDGFGDPGVVTNACAAPSGFVANNTDCADGDANAHPGQTAWFTARITGSFLSDPLNYDYDCDGIVVKQYTTLSNCSSGTLRDGWQGTPIPYCGSARDFNIVLPRFYVCGTVLRTQSCH